MARPKNNVQFTATIGDLCFYQRNGKTYLREAKALDRELVLNDDRFKKTMEHANKMALASKIASAIYKDLPKERKARWVFRSITGHAASLLYKGEHEESVKEILHSEYIFNPESALKNVPKTYRTGKNYSEKKADKLLRDLFKDRWEKTGKNKEDFDLAWKEPRSYNSDNRKHFNHIYEFLVERFSNLPYINVIDALGERITPNKLQKLLSKPL